MRVVCKHVPESEFINLKVLALTEFNCHSALEKNRLQLQRARPAIALPIEKTV